MALDLTSAPKAPPRVTKSRAVTPGGKTSNYVSPKTQEREDAANGLFQLGGFGLIVTRNYADAGALGKYGPGISHELALLSEKNEGVAKVLDYLTEAGPYAGLITAMMPLVLQIMANHNVIKPEAVAGAGVVHPDALSAQVKADMARATGEALRLQREAEQELATLADEVRKANANQNGSAEAQMGTQNA